MKPRVFRLELAMLVLIAALPVLYGAGYVWARLTHRLVWYGSFVARPNAGSGIGFSDFELFFAPLTFSEEVIRVHVFPRR